MQLLATLVETVFKGHDHIVESGRLIVYHDVHIVAQPNAVGMGDATFSPVIGLQHPSHQLWVLVGQPVPYFRESVVGAGWYHSFQPPFLARVVAVAKMCYFWGCASLQDGTHICKIPLHEQLFRLAAGAPHRHC